MNNKYRVDWKAGMRLTDEIFRASDEFYVACLQPLYSVLVNGNYGLLDLPIFRYELNDANLSITELQINAISFSGKLIQLSFNRSERMLFQNINLPNVSEPIIMYIDKSSDKTIKVTDEKANVPLCDADYQILVKLESKHYDNPDAVPFARFVYNHGWSNDSSYIAPCISLRANGVLLRAASNYVVELETLKKALKEACDTDQYILVMSVLPVLNQISIEIQKEADSMTPRHLISLMQTGIQILCDLSDTEGGIAIPEKNRCISFVESHYTPYVISELINEGINLTRVLVDITKSFGNKPIEAEHQEERVRPPRRTGSTDSIRKKHH